MDLYSTFHSVYISTLNVIYVYVKNLISTFHSVYISTQLHTVLQGTYTSLHSTLFILVLILCPVGRYVARISTFHSVYISTRNPNQAG